MTPHEAAIKALHRRRWHVAAQAEAGDALAWYGPVRAPTLHRVRP